MPESRATMSDWQKAMRLKGLTDLADELDTDKEADVKRLIALDLPQDNWFRLPYEQFTSDNNQLTNWLEEYASKGLGFCIRAVPTKAGYDKGFTRIPTRGFLSYQDCKEFLANATRTHPGTRGSKLWRVVISTWEPNTFGGVLISGERYVLGEIGANLDKLTAMREDPLASFLFDRAGLGYITDKTHWTRVKDEIAKNTLWSTFTNYIICGSDHFDPILRPGYFEFVIIKRDATKFVDYKKNPAYLAGL